MKLQNNATQKELLKGLVQTTGIVVDKVLDTYTKTEVDEAIKDFATESYVDEKVGAIEIPEIGHLATKEEVESAINSIEIPSLDGYATESYVDTAIENIPAVDFSGIATEEFVMKEIMNAEIADKEYDLEIFYTKSETTSLIDEKVENGTQHLANKEELQAAKDEMNTNIADAVKDFESKYVDEDTISIFNAIVDKLA